MKQIIIIGRKMKDNDHMVWKGETAKDRLVLWDVCKRHELLILNGIGVDEINIARNKCMLEGYFLLKG